MTVGERGCVSAPWTGERSTGRLRNPARQLLLDRVARRRDAVFRTDALADRGGPYGIVRIIQHPPQFPRGMARPVLTAVDDAGDAQSADAVGVIRLVVAEGH